MSTSINPTTVAPSSGPYSAAVASGGLLFLSGHGPFTADGERVGDTFAEQVRQTLRNIEAVADAAGASLANTVRIGAYVSSLNRMEEFNEVMREFFTEPFPARTTIPVALQGFDIEIDAVIELPAEHTPVESSVTAPKSGFLGRN